MMTYDISTAEMEVMRVLWAQSPISGRQIIERLLTIRNWKEGTIKSLIHRLILKGLIHKDESQKPYALSPTVNQEEATWSRIEGEFNFVCTQERGDVIHHLLEISTLSRVQLTALSDLIARKLVDAPEQVPCLCPPGQCRHHHLNNNGAACCSNHTHQDPPQTIQ